MESVQMTPSNDDHNELDASFNDESPSRGALILYATETGNAQECADYIARQCRRVSFRCRVVSVDAYSLVSLSFAIKYIGSHRK